MGGGAGYTLLGAGLTLALRVVVCVYARRAQRTRFLAEALSGGVEPAAEPAAHSASPSEAAKTTAASELEIAASAEYLKMFEELFRRHPELCGSEWDHARQLVATPPGVHAQSERWVEALFNEWRTSKALVLHCFGTPPSEAAGPSQSIPILCSGSDPRVPVAYLPPRWIPNEMMERAPLQRLQLAQLPTCIHRWGFGDASGRTQLWIKRDDYTGSELSGNKVRKLEFLIAKALAEGCDCVITVGGLQSSHCRATAAAARRVGLEPHLILRTSGDPDADPGCEGNLLLDRMLGAKLHLVSEECYQAQGGWPLCCALRDRLANAGRKAFAFPSGGSDALGSWGYIEAVAELERQLFAERQLSTLAALDRIYFACGSGGTATGLALGLHLSSLHVELVGLAVDDSPDVFYDKIDSLATELGAHAAGLPRARQLLRIVDCVGEGYAHSSSGELAFIAQVGRATGVLLDPVYTGKAALGMAHDLQVRPVVHALFVHTGGLFGLAAKASQLRRHVY